MQRLGNALVQLMKDLSVLSTNGHAEVRVNSNLTSPERFEQLFNHFTRGTVLERLNLDIKGMQPEAACSCGYRQKIQGEHSGYIKCPECGKFAEIRDRPYKIVSPEPSRTGERKSIRF